MLEISRQLDDIWQRQTIKRKYAAMGRNDQKRLLLGFRSFCWGFWNVIGSPECNPGNKSLQPRRLRQNSMSSCLTFSRSLNLSQVHWVREKRQHFHWNVSHFCWSQRHTRGNSSMENTFGENTYYRAQFCIRKTARWHFNYVFPKPPWYSLIHFSSDMHLAELK